MTRTGERPPPGLSGDVIALLIFRRAEALYVAKLEPTREAAARRAVGDVEQTLHAVTSSPAAVQLAEWLAETTNKRWARDVAKWRVGEFLLELERVA
jgi:hypothetical protein